MAEDGGTVVNYCLVLLVLGGSLVQVCPQVVFLMTLNLENFPAQWILMCRYCTDSKL